MVGFGHDLIQGLLQPGKVPGRCSNLGDKGARTLAADEQAFRFKNTVSAGNSVWIDRQLSGKFPYRRQLLPRLEHAAGDGIANLLY